MLKLNVIVASTRPGRKGPAVARWIDGYARTHGAFEPVFVDLAEVGLPMFDEAKHPAMRQYEHEHTKRWSAIVGAADAFAFVTPEYNFVPPPSLVNALDFLVHEWGFKPAGIVSYGGVSGGLRAAQALKLQLTALRMMPIPEGVPIPNFASHIREDGAFHSNEMIDTSAKTMLDALHRWATALKPARG
ncbi:NADPH-dependent FMN reductase [Roseomonas sp. CCTCC AB2023176]|uniref:NADPH-dependent FMN reductase n=1 Tax=Roseomonas sp. CCTCC AB2023176 TaxID=3342640 RepID=UPI0035E2EA9A